MEIEKNIPIPVKSSTTLSKTPHTEMEVGDSIYLTGTGVKRQYQIIRTYSWRTGKKFCVKSDANGMRVWRIE